MIIKTWVLLKDIVDAGYDTPDVKTLLEQIKAAGASFELIPYGKIVSGQSAEMSAEYVFGILKNIGTAEMIDTHVFDLLKTINDGGKMFAECMFDLLKTIGDEGEMFAECMFDLLKTIGDGGEIADSYFKVWDAERVAPESINMVDDDNYYHYTDVTYTNSLNITA